MSNHNENTENIALGALLLLIAFFLGAVQNALIKAIHNLPTSEIVFFQYALCLSVFIPLIIKTRFKIMKSHRTGLLVVRSLAGLGYFFGMFYALKSITLVDVSLLTNTAPIWTPLVCLIWLNTKIRKQLYIWLALGFIGVSFILAPDNKIFSAGAFIALASGLSMAIAMVSVKQLGSTEPSQRIMIYYFLITSVFMLPLTIMHWETPTVIQLSILILNAILMLAHQWLLNKGFKYGSAHRLSSTTYSSVIFSAILGWIFWNETLSYTTIIGSLLIILGGYKAIMMREMVNSNNGSFQSRSRNFIDAV